jgi:hypothetical protein
LEAGRPIMPIEWIRRNTWHEAKSFLPDQEYPRRKHLILKTLECCEAKRLHLAVDVVVCRLTLCISNDVTGIMLRMPLCI